MSVILKIKLARMRLAIAKGHKQAQKLALAVVLMQYMLAGGWYIAEKNDLLSFLEPKTIFIYKVEAKQESQEAKKPESITETIARVAKEKNFQDVDTLIKLAECESSLNRYAKNSQSSARGLFQILDMHGLTEDERYNPEIATSWTIDKIRKAGMRPWEASRHCWDNQ